VIFHTSCYTDICIIACCTLPLSSFFYVARVEVTSPMTCGGLGWLKVLLLLVDEKL
jgi:hypothetical protein